MSKDYKINAVSPEQKHWASQYGDMVTYYIKLEGEGEEPVQLNKKVESPAPKDGDELYGEVVDTQYGLRFKGAKKAFTPQGYQKSLETEEAIARAVALKAAVEYIQLIPQFQTEPKPISPSSVLATADEFLAWLKGEKPATEAPKQPEGKIRVVPIGSGQTTEEAVREWEKVNKKDEVHEPIEGDQIDLKDIPF